MSCGSRYLVRDGDFTLSKAEVEYALAASPPQIRESVMERRGISLRIFFNVTGV